MIEIQIKMYKATQRFIGAMGLLLVLTLSGFAQDDWNVIIDGKVVSGSKKLENANITLYKNGSVDKRVRTPINGKFTLTLYPENDYLIEIAKDGFVTKKISFNTEGVPEESVGSGFPSYPITVDIFENIKGLDTKILDQPIGRIRYYSKGDNFNFDEAYTRQIQDQLKQLRADIEAKMEEYKEAMDNGGRYSRSKDYEKARQSYEIALDILPNERLPKTKLAEIEKLIEQDRLKAEEAKIKNAAAEEAARIKELEEKYQRAIAAGESALKLEKYEGAKGKYQEALELKPAEALPKQKLEEIDAKLKVLSLQKEEAKKKAEEEARLRAIEESYKKAITTADAAMTSKQFESARTAYENALEIKPNENYPKEQLALIEKKIEEEKLREADAQRDAAEAARLKKVEAEYMSAIGAGATAMKNKDFTEAKSKYNLALTIKPEEAYPKEKLAEIDQLIKAEELAKEEAAKKAEEAARLKAEEEARIKAEAAEKERLAAELEAKYTTAISEADQAFNAEDYYGAKKKYEYALTLKSRENYPNAQLDAIEDILFQLDKEEAAKRKLDNEYNAAIMVGDQAFSQGNYSVAKSQYQAALGIKPDATYPKDQLVLIEKELENQKKVDEEAARLALEQQKEQEKEKRYQNALTKADNAFNNGYFQNAKKFYVEALGVKPNESYPTNRIGVIEKKLEEQQRATELEKQKAAEAEAKKALDNQYLGLIKDGDVSFNLKEYDKAKTNYQKALELKPGEAYPLGKLEEIEKLVLAEKRKKQEEAEQLGRYQSLIDSGDQELMASNYNQALTHFNDALSIQPNETYPKAKIKEIKGILEDERKKQEAEENKKLEEEKRRGEMAEKTERYQQLIANGDKAMVDGNFSDAVTFFEQAKMIFPGKTYPKDKLNELRGLIAEAAAKKAAKEEEVKKREQEYQESIVRGNGAFDLGRYSEAKGYYEKALSVKPDAQYPKEKLADIFKKMAEMRDRAAELERLQAEAAKKEAPEPTQEKERFLTELALEYPEGLTEETYNEGDKKITRRIVVKDGRSDDYRMVVQPWGAKFYFKNDHSIPKHQFDTETNNVD